MAATYSTPADAPKHFAILLFKGFQALDAFGPLDSLNLLSLRTPLKFSILAETHHPVSTALPPSQYPSGGSVVGQAVVPTHTFADAPHDIDFLLVPGGLGTKDEAAIEAAVQFVKERAPKLKYIMSVCTGAVLLAQAGVLDGKRATSNKASWDYATGEGPKTYWVADARWVVDGNVWTTSGISAGMDGFLAFIAQAFGEAVADRVALSQEYVRKKEPSPDAFSKHWALHDVPPRA